MGIGPRDDARGRWRLRHVIVASLVGAVVMFGLLAADVFRTEDAGAQNGLRVQLVTSPTGTSGEVDSAGLSVLRFDQAQDRISSVLAARPNQPTLTLPFSILGLSGTTMEQVTMEIDQATAMISFTGSSPNIVGGALGRVEVLVVVDWFESNPFHDTPRVVVSASVAGGRLGELINLNDGSLIADVPLLAGAITVSNKQDARLPDPLETLLDPSDMPANAQTYWRRVFGPTLPNELPLRGLLNIAGNLALGQVSPAINQAVGMTESTAMFVQGSINGNLGNFPGGVNPKADGFSLKGVAAGFQLPQAVQDLVGTNLTTDRIFEIGYDAQERRLRMQWGAKLQTSAPLPSLSMTLAVRAEETQGPERIRKVTILGSIGDWNAPFGIDWLNLENVALGFAITETRAANGDITTNQSGFLKAEATLGGKAIVVKVTGDVNDKQLTIQLALNDPISLRELLRSVGQTNADMAAIPAHVLDAAFGPAALVVDIKDQDVAISGTGTFSFKVRADAQNPIAASLFFEVRVVQPPGSNGVSIGIRPSGPLRLSDIVDIPGPDFELVSERSAFGFLFTTDPITAPRVRDLTFARNQFLLPLYGGDPRAEVAIPAGFSLLGTIELPDELANFVGDSLGLTNVVRLTGTVPIGVQNDPQVALSLALKLDPDRTPEWIDAGRLAITVSATGGANPTLAFELKGALTVKFHAGMPAELSEDLAALGIETYPAIARPAGFSGCPGASVLLPTQTPAGLQNFCYDRLTFSVTARLSISPTEVSAELTLALDTAAMGESFGWNPFGLEWLTINRVALKVGIQWEAAAPPPGISISIGFSGDVALGNKDLLVAGKVSIQPLPYPPFAIVKPEGFRMASAAGFALDDFFAIQHEMAERAAVIRGENPNNVAGPYSVNDLGIPNIALRNLDFSFSTDGDPDLCIPRGLFISADIYIDPTDEPTPRGPKCGIENPNLPAGPIAAPAGTSCSDNKDKGCLAGGRIEISPTGFKALIEINGFELGPVTFEDAVLDMELSLSNPHFLLRGGVAIDPIGKATVQASIEPFGIGLQTSLAGRLDIGPPADPFFSALVESTFAFNLAQLDQSGFSLRVVLDASNLNLGELADAFEEAANQEIDQAEAEVNQFLDQVNAAYNQWNSDPARFVNVTISQLGINMDPAVRTFLGELAEEVQVTTAAGEAALLRGQFGGVPTGGTAPFLGCGSPLHAFPALLNGTNYCITIPTPSIRSREATCPALQPFPSGSRCYTIVPSFFDGDGTPNGGVAPILSCPRLTHAFTVTLSGTKYCSTTPFSAVSPQLVCDFFMVGGRCYTIPPIDGLGLCDGLRIFYSSLPSNCDIEDIINFVVRPTIQAGFNFTRLVAGQVAGFIEIMDQVGRLECAEFQLVVNGQQQSVSVSIVMRFGNDLRGLSMSWDLAKPLSQNLAGLAGLLGNDNPGSCPPVQFTTFADDVIGGDGGELLVPPTLRSDQVTIDEQRTTQFRPMANDLDVETAVITAVSAPAGLNTAISDDGRSIMLTPTIANLSPGALRGFTVSYTVTNDAGLSASQNIAVNVRGIDAPPQLAPDTAVLQLAAGTNTTSINVVANDTNGDGGGVLVGAVSTTGTAGCASIDSSDARRVVYTDRRCGSNVPAFAYLAAGEEAIDVFTYAATDLGGTSGAAVTVTVRGQNDAPVISAVEVSDATVADGSTVLVTGTFTDPDLSDTHVVQIQWGDGLTTSLALGPQQRSFSLTHRYGAGLQPGLLPIIVEVSDGGLAGTTTEFVAATGVATAPATPAPGHTIAANSSGMQVLAAVKESGALYTRTYDPQSGWSGWFEHGARTWVSVDITIDENGTIRMVGLKNDGRLYTRTGANSQWFGWTLHGAPTWDTGEMPAIAAVPGMVAISAVKTDGRLYTRVWDGSWGQWDLHGAPTWDSVDIAMHTNGTLRVLGTKDDGRLYTRSRSPQGNWGGFTLHGAPTWTTSHAAAITVAGDAVVIAGVKTDGRAYTRIWNGAWGGWQLHGAPTWSAVDIVGAANGELWLIGSKQDGRLYTRRFSGGSWGGWRAMGAPTWSVGPNPAIAFSAGHPVMLAVKEDGRLYSRIEAGGQWQAWIQHGAPTWVS